MDIEGLKTELRRRALMADDNMGDSEAFDKAADAIEQLQRENERLKQAAETEAQLADEFKRELEEARKDAERWKQWKQWWSNTSDDEWHLPESVVVALDDLDIDDAMDAAREKQG